jgi:hypothetical protein
VKTNIHRHIFLSFGILIIVTFFTRISRTALYDGFFSKIEDLHNRNCQAVDYSSATSEGSVSEVKQIQEGPILPVFQLLKFFGLDNKFPGNVFPEMGSETHPLVLNAYFYLYQRCVCYGFAAAP